jgi:hypothetical protein
MLIFSLVNGKWSTEYDEAGGRLQIIAVHAVTELTEEHVHQLALETKRFSFTETTGFHFDGVCGFASPKAAESFGKLFAENQRPQFLVVASTLNVGHFIRVFCTTFNVPRVRVVVDPTLESLAALPMVLQHATKRQTTALELACSWAPQASGDFSKEQFGETLERMVRQVFGRRRTRFLNTLKMEADELLPEFTRAFAPFISVGVEIELDCSSGNTDAVLLSVASNVGFLNLDYSVPVTRGSVAWRSFPNLRGLSLNWACTHMSFIRKIVANAPLLSEVAMVSARSWLDAAAPLDASLALECLTTKHANVMEGFECTFIEPSSSTDYVRHALRFTRLKYISFPENLSLADACEFLSSTKCVGVEVYHPVWGNLPVVLAALRKAAFSNRAAAPAFAHDPFFSSAREAQTALLTLFGAAVPSPLARFLKKDGDNAALIRVLRYTLPSFGGGEE